MVASRLTLRILQLSMEVKNLRIVALARRQLKHRLPLEEVGMGVDLNLHLKERLSLEEVLGMGMELHVAHAAPRPKLTAVFVARVENGNPVCIVVVVVHHWESQPY